MWKIQGLNMPALDVLLKIKLHGQDIFLQLGSQIWITWSNNFLAIHIYTTIGMHVGWKGINFFANEMKVASWLGGVPYGKKILMPNKKLKARS
jgi:hypothetical protein